MMVINNNIPALTTYGIVNNTSNALEKSIKKLSTGLRINSAADDAAGLSISEKMRAQINGLDRAVANAQDGVSLIQTAEGALTETHSILQRMRELSVQAANDTYTQQDRSYIQEEIDLLRDEIDHIGNTTTFNTKKLLNGDAAVLWSSDKLSTKAIVNGGLREIDQFGQKKSFEGNYKINIVADPGQAEIQKTDIFRVKHSGADVGVNARIDKGVQDYVTKMTTDTENTTNDPNATTQKYGISEGVTYTVKSTAAAADVSPAQVASYATNSSSMIKASDLFVWDDVSDAGTYELAVSYEKGTGDTGVYTVTEGGTSTNPTYQASATLRVRGFYTAVDGTVTLIDESVVLTSENDATGSAASSDVTVSNAHGLKIKADYTSMENLSTLTKGDAAVYTGVISTGADANMQVTYTGTDGKSWTHDFALTDAAIGPDKDVSLAYVNLNEDTGDLSLEKINFHTETAANGWTADSYLDGKTIGTIKYYEVGDVAQDNVKLRDLEKFWDSQGNFMLEDPQTLTITQGNGKQTTVTLYGHDTLADVEEKLNKAIAEGLGQKDYINSDDTDGVNHFVDFVNQATDTSSESVEGTFLIRSLVPGKDGTLRFASKSEDLLNAFSFNTIQDSKESVYTVNITDAHTGESIVSNEKITGNKLIGKLHENIDVEFDAMGGVTAKWDDDLKKFKYDDNTSGSDTILHLADNTMVFQIGANSGDDMSINIGDMRSHALGLDAVLVTDRDSASRSITIIDNAIDKVSTQRAKLGAYQNRLEHTMTNLETSSENLSAAESRIRDTDMAKEMMNFTKLQIMLQAGNSMLAQANQLPQNVLSLIR